MEAVPLHLREANKFVAKYQRHNLPAVGGKFAVGAALDGKLVGVAIAGRPMCRRLDDGKNLELGDLVFLYTDGIVEAGSTAGKPFGLERTLGIVRKHQQETPDEILKALFDEVSDFSEHRLQDDLTAVIIKAEGAA